MDAPVGSASGGPHHQVQAYPRSLEAGESDPIDAATVQGIRERSFGRWCRRYEDEGPCSGRGRHCRGCQPLQPRGTSARTQSVRFAVKR